MLKEYTIMQQGYFQACAYISATNDVLVLGRSTAFKWNVMSENYFSVTFQNGSSTDTTAPRYVGSYMYLHRNAGCRL